jgi:hypothetical protein
MARLKKKNLIENEKEVVSLNPKKLINYFYEKVDLTTSAVLIFIAVFIEALFLLFLKLPNVVEYFTINLIINFIFSWIILGALLYVVLYFVKGRSGMKGEEYKKILSGLAAFRVITILSLLVLLAIIFIFMPKLLSYISLILQNPSTAALPNLGVGAGVGIFLLVIFGISLLIYYLVMFYHFVDKMYDFQDSGKTFFITVFLLVILFFFSILI